ncbi:hypothetical protein L7F22_055466 [Adiantum nelumboides]|nr:hypothetical protein [Adiantum nelumboides]
MISQGFRPPRMEISPTVHAVNVRPTLLSTSLALVAFHPPVTSSSDSTKGPKCPRVTTTVWDETATSTLLKHYEERWSHVNKGNLRPKDWEQVTLQLNNEVTHTFTPEQVRNCRIDTLRKKYKKKVKNNNTGRVRSWEYFEVVDTLWSSTPRCVGILGSFDSESSHSHQTGSQGHQEGEGVNDGEEEEEGEVGVEGGGNDGGKTKPIVEKTVSVGGTADGENTTRVPQVQDLPQESKHKNSKSLNAHHWDLLPKCLGRG